MKSIVLLLVLILSAGIADAQRSINSFPGSVNNSLELMQDGWGRPMYLKTEYQFTGSPFWPEEYFVANLTVKNGAQYKGILTKVNLLTQLVLFKGSDGADMEVTAEVRKIQFADTSGPMQQVLLMSGFPTIEKFTSANFYQVLDTGKYKLLKTYEIRIDEKTQYGYAGVTKELMKTPRYFLFTPDSKMLKMEKGKNALYKILADKKSFIETYLQQEKIKLQKEADFIKVIRYLNTLP